MPDKTIWIDLDNSPHVPLFAPIIRHYREKGVEVVLTARRHSQTIELLELHGFGSNYKVIGRHHGRGALVKVLGTLERARRLASYIKGTDRNISVAISHGSRAMVLAAWWLKIPVVTMYDYEFTETRVFNRFSTRVLVPEGIGDDVLDDIGLSVKKRLKYPGIKEELYLRNFLPDKDFREKFFAINGLEIGDDKIVAVLRPPATTANYHTEKSRELFEKLLKFLLHNEQTFTVIVPRTGEQAAEVNGLISRLGLPSKTHLILTEAVDGLNLAAAANLLISGGGTMNREAVLLGIPVYSIFAGRQGALDRQMESTGLITFIRDARDLSKIRLEGRDPQRPNALTERVERFVIDQIDAFLDEPPNKLKSES